MKRVWIIGLAAAVLLVVLGFTAWFLLRTRSSADFETDGVDHTLAMVPASSALYIGLQLTELTNPALATFAFLFSDIQTLMRDLQSQHGVIPDDFLGWTGETASLAVTTLTRDAFTGEPSTEWVLIVESRNAQNGRDFVEQVAAHWSENGRMVEETQNEDGTLLFTANHLDGGRPEAIAYAERVLLFGSPDSVAAALAARSGASLANDTHFAALAARLPADAPLTFALQTNEMGRLALNAAGEALPVALPEIPLDAYGLTVGSVSTLGQQVTIDAYTQVDVERFTATQRELFETTAGFAETAVYAPDDALLYANGSGASLFWQLYGESAASDAGVENPLQPLLTQANNLLGIDLEADLLNLLDGDTAFVLRPGDGGAVGALAETQLDAVLLLQSSQPKQIVNTLQQLHDALTGGFLPVGTVDQSNTTDGQTLYATSVLLFPDVTVHYSTTQIDLALGSSAAALDALVYDEGGSFANRADFIALLAQISPEMTPGTFVDVDALAAHLAEQGSVTAQQAAYWMAVDFGGTAVAIENELQKTSVVFLLK